MRIGKCCAVGLLAIASSWLEAGSDDPRRFPKQADVAGRNLVLNGTGLCEWGIFAIDLYHAALYLETPTRSAKHAIESRQRKRVHLRFARSLTRSQLQQAWTAAVKINAGSRWEEHRRELATLNAMMKDVNAGDSIIFDCVPDTGIRVWMDRRTKGVIRGDAFAKLFIRLYLGQHPPDPNLKRGLLRGRS